MSLPTPVSSVETLQKALQAKAKLAADCRFYTLWDKVWRWDVLVEAYRRCRANGGAPGVDGQSFAAIESDGGVGPWLAALREECNRSVNSLLAGRGTLGVFKSRRGFHVGEAA